MGSLGRAGVCSIVCTTDTMSFISRTQTRSFRLVMTQIISSETMLCLIHHEITGDHNYNSSTPMALRTFLTYVFDTGFNLLITLLSAGPKNVSSNSRIWSAFLYLCSPIGRMASAFSISPAPCGLPFQNHLGCMIQWRCASLLSNTWK